jgi:general stress protein YciG
MTIHEHLLKAVKDDARRAGERDRVLLEASRARAAGRAGGASRGGRFEGAPTAAGRRWAWMLLRRAQRAL